MLYELQELLNIERNKSFSALEAKLNARRQGKTELAKALVEKQAVIGWEDEERKLLNQKMAGDLTNKQKKEIEQPQQVMTMPH